MHTKTTIPALLLLLFIGISTAFARAEELPQPQKMIVDGTNNLLEGLIEKHDVIKKDRAVADELVARHVLPYIDFDRTAQLVLGKYWRRASDEQRNRFTVEFKQFLINNYTTAMIEFSDEIVNHAKYVKHIPMRNHDDRYADVRMDINLPDRTPVQVNYSLFNAGNGWKIYDIAIEGVSLATTYRSQFASEIRRGSLDQLISRLADRNLQRTAEPGTSGN